MTERELRFVLAHEMGHCRYRDLAARGLIQTALIFHWFNPLVWLAARAAKTDCEIACDEFVIRRLSPEDPSAYGETLLKAVAMASPLKRTPGTLGVAGSKQRIRQRIRRIAAFKPPNRTVVLIGVGLLAAMAGLNLTRETHAEQPAGNGSSCAEQNGPVRVVEKRQ